jgi:hypothetical protein
MFTEFVGLSQDVANLIEGRRTDPTDSKNDILRKLLVSPLGDRGSADEMTVEIGQGVQLIVGEKLYLFLSKEAKAQRRSDGLAEVRADGIYVDGEKIRPSKGSAIHPAMVKFQHRANHVDRDGRPVSLNAYRQWHVVRKGDLVPLVDLKDPALARTRGRKVDVEALLA